MAGLFEMLGLTMFNSMRDEVEKYVESQMYDWAADVHGYAGEMEESQKEDYQEGRREDKMLDARLLAEDVRSKL
jgi:hypothetical protein